MINGEKTPTALKEDESCDAEFEAMFEHVCQNADSYGVADEPAALVLAHMLILEKEGRVYRTGEKRLSPKGLMQDVFAAVKAN